MYPAGRFDGALRPQSGANNGGFFQCVAVRRGVAFPFLLAWSAAAKKCGVASEKKEVSPPFGKGFAPGGRGVRAPPPGVPLRLVGHHRVVPFLLGFGGCSGRFASSGGGKSRSLPRPPSAPLKNWGKKKKAHVVCAACRGARFGAGSRRAWFLGRFRLLCAFLLAWSWGFAGWRFYPAEATSELTRH